MSRSCCLPSRSWSARSLVVEESADEFAFRHALTREAVYASLLLRERQALHRLIGETMEQLWGAADPAHVAELAYHFDQAAVWDKAIEYSDGRGRAGPAAVRPARGAGPFLARTAGSGAACTSSAFLVHPKQPRPRCSNCWANSMPRGTTMKGRWSWPGSQGDRQGEWSTLIDLGFLWQSRDWVRAGEYFQRAYDLARSLEETALVAQSLNRHWQLVLESRPRRARDCHAIGRRWGSFRSCMTGEG